MGFCVVLFEMSSRKNLELKLYIVNYNLNSDQLNIVIVTVNNVMANRFNFNY
jgi:hypothetical protein